MFRSIVAKAGRWLAAEHPDIVEPAQWTRETCAAEFEHGPVDGVVRGAGEAAQDRLGGCGAGADRDRVLDHRVVRLGDQVPADRAGHRRGQAGVALGLTRGQPVKLHLVDLFDPREQLEPEQAVIPNPISDRPWEST
jgi:hypothetical protein